MCQWPVTESPQLGQWFCALALAPKPSLATKPSNQVRLIGEPLRSVDSWGFSISHAAGWWDSELVNRWIGGLVDWWIGEKEQSFIQPTQRPPKPPNHQPTHPPTHQSSHRE